MLSGLGQAFIFIYKIFLFCVGVELMDNAVIMSGD